MSFGKLDTVYVVASISLSCFEAYAGLFRLIVKGIFDAYVLWAFDENFIFELVMQWELVRISENSRLYVIDKSHIWFVERKWIDIFLCTTKVYVLLAVMDVSKLRIIDRKR